MSNLLLGKRVIAAMVERKTFQWYAPVEVFFLFFSLRMLNMTQLQEVSYQIDIAQVKNCSLSCNSRGRKTFTMKICVKTSKRLLTSFYKNNSTHVIKKSQPFCPCTIACWNQLKSSLAAFFKYWFKIYNKFFVTNHRSHNCNNTD